MPEVYEALCCFRLTTDTGTILELWELSDGNFEILAAENHKPDEVVYAATLSLVEAEMFAEKITMATSAVRNTGQSQDTKGEA